MVDFQIVSEDNNGVFSSDIVDFQSRIFKN